MKTKILVDFQICISVPLRECILLHLDTGIEIVRYMYPIKINETQATHHYMKHVHNFGNILEAATGDVL